MKSQPGEASKTESDEKKNPARGIVIISIVAIVVIIAAIFGVKAFIYNAAHESTDDAQVDGDLVAVTSKIAERVATIEVKTNTYVHKGQILVRLDDADEKRRYAQAEATLKATQAQAQAATATVSLTGDQQRAQVTQGDGGVSQALAGVQSAQQQVMQAQDEYSVANANVATAQAQLRSAQALAAAAGVTEQRANDDLRRLSSLSRTGDTSASDLDTARATAANARASHTQALANIAVAQASLNSARDKYHSQHSAILAAQAMVGVQQAQVQTAQGKLAEAASPYRITTQEANELAVVAQVATQRAAAQQIADQLSYTVIRSPIDGFIGEKNVEAGQTVSPGETLLTVIPNHGLYITANYKETQVGKIRPGQKAEISIDAYPGREIDGHVEAMPPASQATYSLIPAQNSTGNFVKVTQRLPVRIVVDSGIDENHQLRVGMSVETAVSVK